MDCSVLDNLEKNADVFNKNREETWFVLFLKSGFTKSLIEKAGNDGYIVLYDLQDICL